MARRLSLCGILFLSLFLFSYSCEDHQVPGVPPVLVTLSVSPGPIRCEVAFNLNVVDTGNIPVTEFGMVIAGVGFKGPASDIPTIESNTKLVFDPPFTTGTKKKNSGVCSNNMAYRTYAILNTGKVVYGNLLLYQDL